MKERTDAGWFARFPKDLAWDIFTLDCIAATVLALGIAGVAAASQTFADRIAESEHWLWVVVFTLTIVAVVCLVRMAWPDRFEQALPRRRR